LPLAQGLILNCLKGSLKVLNLNNNRIGSKGVQLICEALKDHSKLESLFLDDNGIDSDGAHSICKLLSVTGDSSSLDLVSNLKELHVAHNRMASAGGLSLILETLSKSNKSLKFLDISFNLIDIGALRPLRLMLERNTTLQYLTVSDLHKFNSRAIESLSESLATSTGVKLVDFKRTTKSFFKTIERGVNALREQVGKPSIVFLRDSQYIAAAATDTSRISETRKAQKKASKQGRSRTPEPAARPKPRARSSSG